MKTEFKFRKSIDCVDCKNRLKTKCKWDGDRDGGWCNKKPTLAKEAIKRMREEIKLQEKRLLECSKISDNYSKKTSGA